jgi:ATP-dependent DNA ligase
MQEETISLYCKDASSDKEYHLDLKASGNGFVVNYRNGPRGGPLRSGTKTNEPVAYEIAKKKYDSVVREKTKGGYTRGESGAAYVGTEDEARVSGILPQLLNPIHDSELERYITDDEWVAQEKHNGHRRLVRTNEDKSVGINKKGLTTGLPAEIAQALTAAAQNKLLTVDAELMKGGSLHVFDLLDIEGADQRQRTFQQRLTALAILESRLQAAGATCVRVTYTARTTQEKRELVERLRELNREGVVFRRRSSLYVAGRPSRGGDAIKFQFRKQATVIVASHHPTKSSIGVELLSSEGKRVKVGNITVPSNEAMPPIGALVEVKYLFIHEGGSLNQPEFLYVRTDVELCECTLAQLVYTPKDLEEQDEEDTEVA